MKKCNTMKICRKYLVLIITVLIFMGCEEEAGIGFTAANLKVFHGAVDAPAVHVNYFGRDMTFFNNPALFYNQDERFTLPPGISREVKIVNADDTLAQLLSTAITLEAGDIGTLFLVGQGEEIRGLFFNESLPTLTDSLTGVRFIHLSSDSGPVSVTLSGQDGNLTSDLSYLDDSGYLELDARRQVGTYVFEFRDGDDNIIGTASLEVIPERGTNAVFKYHTFALTGLNNDGNGGNSLSVQRINYYLKR